MVHSWEFSRHREYQTLLQAYEDIWALGQTSYILISSLGDLDTSYRWQSQNLLIPIGSQVSLFFYPKLPNFLYPKGIYKVLKYRINMYFKKKSYTQCVISKSPVLLWGDRAGAEHWTPLENDGFLAVLRNTQILVTIFTSPSMP